MKAVYKYCYLSRTYLYSSVSPQSQLGLMLMKRNRNPIHLRYFQMVSFFSRFLNSSARYRIRLMQILFLSDNWFRSIFLSSS